MKPTRVFLLLSVVILLASCSAPGLGRLGKKNHHDQYARKLTEAGLKESALGQLWFSAASQALQDPLEVTLPYKQTGYFAPDKPRAVGLRFTAERGAKLIFQLETKALSSFTLYTDLWRAEANGNHKLLLSLDSASGNFTHEVEDDDESFILRLQPELLSSGEYTLSISVGPSLAFPVAGGAARIGSFWGAERDAGARSHEGIDIFAPRGTPVLAAADGTAHRVGDNRLGGKVIFLRPKGKALSLYYAHLDSQLVRSGDRVSVGDTIGLVGNTGNARTTPPHLHFGIYTRSGAINPFAFVSPVIKKPGNIPVTADDLNKHYRLAKTIQTEGLNLERNTVLFVQDAGTQGIIAKTPDGKKMALPFNSIQAIDNQLSSTNDKDTLFILEAPLSSAPVKRKLLPGAPVRVQGYYKEFAFVSDGVHEQGWVPRTDLR